MEALLNTSSAAYLTPKAPKFVITNCCSSPKFQNPCMKFANGYSPFTFSGQFTTQKLPIGLRGSVIVRANKNHKNKKEDTHSFVPKQDEATGFFPEAVLLKEKVQDGQLLPEFADAEEQSLYETLMLDLESETVLEQMRHYEVVYLIHEKHEEEVESVNEKVQDFLREKKGKIWRVNDWGMRRLAYKIKKAKNAHYFLMNFELEATWINDFKSMLDKDERVIRHLVMKRDEAETEDCPPPPEFHTLRAGMDDNDEEDDVDYDDDYDNEEDGEDWDDEGEMDGYDDETEDGIIVVKDDAGDKDHTNDISAIIRNQGRKNLRAEKVGR
ncbi:protein REGULATOR OF FATTY ACID COMPOSITION 3, chloroplastic-like isoform X2 [Corylus avellana]|uniref:protein REGULATOR OF FATTY ACID COMPOSITION 3, chloroplastic-like isoform X2 n=1 Tax=Corylus avellana TaxID=13451 RepID=UPI00286D57E0|nr:protein REGULATOR OF FATTY ACID COMPOSITION 3, chloroplastic-like isoform X2 [Corylus avellana]